MRGMSSTIVACDQCGKKNRVPAAAVRRTTVRHLPLAPRLDRGRGRRRLRRGGRSGHATPSWSILLAILVDRLDNDPETERRVMRSELAKINRLRLERLLSEPT